MIADLHPKQASRLEALRSYRILDTPRERLYDDIAFLAAQICDSPVAAISFVDEDRQWFKAEIGLGVRQTPLDTSFCAHAILENEFFSVRDTLLDKRFQDNPLCVSGPRIRFYASALLKTPDGLPLGTLFVLDTKPRRVSESQKDALLRLARQVMSLLELRVALNDARTSEELVRSAMDSSPDCIKVLDMEGRVLSINQSGSQMMELDDLSSAVNHYWPEFWPEAEREKATTALQAARNGKQARFSGYCKTKKGKDRFWDVMVSPIVDGEGKPHRILSISRDITVSRVEEAHLRETAKLESLGVLAGGIAHDFNNLLTGVLGNAHLLQRSLNRRHRPLLNDIVSAAEQAADLTRQMLAFSGKGRFLIQRVNLTSMIVNILWLIQTTIDKNVELVLSLDETIPPVEADPGQMQQIIMNLVINASEAMQAEPGKLVISTAAIDIDSTFIGQTFRSDEPALSVGRYVRLEVHDTGTGMSEETMEKIFDPFFTTKFTGRGLGLAAVSGILRGHRGAVRVYSHLGQGTTFKIFLPAAWQSAHTNVGADLTSNEMNRRGWGTILIADDEESFRRIEEVSLRRAGYDVLLATDGKQAVDIFKEHRRDIRLIILDLTMPSMNGEESLNLLRGVDRDVPILLSSGYNPVEIIRRFKPQNIAGFIQKPFTVKQLNAAVEKALESTAQSAKS